MPSKKPASKTKAKAKTKTKAGGKTKTKKPSPALPKQELTVAEQFYIDQNKTKTMDELAEDLGKPLEVVRSHIHTTQTQGRVSRLLIQQKGCTVMTGEASMAADDSRKGNVSEAAIRRAVEKGDYEEAARLKNIYIAQTRQSNDAAEEQKAKYIHFTGTNNGQRRM